MASLGISSDICCYYYIYLSVHDISICCWLCFVCEKLLWVVCFSESLVICLTSFPQYVKVAHFLWCFDYSCIFRFYGCDSGFSSSFVLYPCFSSKYFIVFFQFVLISLWLDMCVIDLVHIYYLTVYVHMGGMNCLISLCWFSVYWKFWSFFFMVYCDN
jgi:hypothetical protein